MALSSACRTMRRCTLCFLASWRIVSPAACPRRIISNNSILALLSISAAWQTAIARGLQVGPNQSINWGQIRASKSLVDAYVYFGNGQDAETRVKPVQ